MHLRKKRKKKKDKEKNKKGRGKQIFRILPEQVTFRHFSPLLVKVKRGGSIMCVFK